MNSMKNVIEKTIHDLDKINIVLSHMAAEELDLDVLRAIAQGGFEMTGTLLQHLEHVLPSFSGDDAPAVASTVDENVAALETLVSSTRKNLDDVLSSLVLALYDEGGLSQQERDAIAKGALELVRRVVHGDLGAYAPPTAEPAPAN